MTKVAIVDTNAKKIHQQITLLCPKQVELIAVEDSSEIHTLAEIDAIVTQFFFPAQKLIPKVKWFHIISAGYSHVPKELLLSQQWVVTYGSGPSSVSIAEWVLTCMLFYAHRFNDILMYQEKRVWWKRREVELLSTTLRSTRVAIIGYGCIGRELGRLCDAHGMEVYASLPASGHKPNKGRYITEGTGDPEGLIPKKWFELNDLKSVLPDCDYVVIGLPDINLKEPLINSKIFDYFKNNALLINFSRGIHIDEEALIDALEKEKIAGACLDVFQNEPLPRNDPLRDAPRLLISPHVSPETEHFRKELSNLVLNNIIRFVHHDRMLNIINA